MLKLISCVALLSVIGVSSYAGQRAPSELFTTIEAADAKLFRAYNECDMGTFGSLVDGEVEFFHDVAGVSQGRQALLDALEKNICNKVHRQLVPGTLQVYPLGDHVAVELGDHLFCKPPTEECDGFAKFAHVWEERDGAWQITRIFSYDHGAASDQKLRASEGSASPELRAEVIGADGALKAALNGCDRVAYASKFTADAVLYQADRGVTRTAEEIGKSLERTCAKGATEFLDVAADSVQVYPMNNYGAMQFEDVLIYKMKSGKRGSLAGKMRDVQLWQQTDAGWKVTRELRYRL